MKIDDVISCNSDSRRREAHYDQEDEESQEVCVELALIHSETRECPIRNYAQCTRPQMMVLASGRFEPKTTPTGATIYITKGTVQVSLRICFTKQCKIKLAPVRRREIVIAGPYTVDLHADASSLRVYRSYSWSDFGSIWLQGPIHAVSPPKEKDSQL